MLAEEDAAAGAGARPLAAAAGPDADGLYKAGDMEAAGLGGKLPMYLIRKVRGARVPVHVCGGVGVGGRGALARVRVCVWGGCLWRVKLPTRP